MLQEGSPKLALEPKSVTASSLIGLFFHFGTTTQRHQSCNFVMRIVKILRSRIMKIWISGIMIVAMSLLAACQSSNDSATTPVPVDNTQYATTPQPCNATQVSPNCYQFPPGQQFPSNWWWPNQWQPTQGYCGCPFGFAPVLINGSMACVPHQFFVQSQVVYFNWGFSFGPTQNNQWNNIPQNQYSNTSAQSTTAQCFNQTAQGCDVRINNCPSGSLCQPVSGGSTIGLCTRGWK